MKSECHWHRKGSHYRPCSLLFEIHEYGWHSGVQFARFYTQRALSLREYTPYTGTAEFSIPFIAIPIWIYNLYTRIGSNRGNPQSPIWIHEAAVCQRQDRGGGAQGWPLIGIPTAVARVVCWSHWLSAQDPGHLRGSMVDTPAPSTFRSADGPALTRHKHG